MISRYLHNTSLPNITKKLAFITKMAMLANRKKGSSIILVGSLEFYTAWFLCSIILEGSSEFYATWFLLPLPKDNFIIWCEHYHCCWFLNRNFWETLLKVIFKDFFSHIDWLPTKEWINNAPGWKIGQSVTFMLVRISFHINFIIQPTHSMSSI